MAAWEPGQQASMLLRETGSIVPRVVCSPGEDPLKLARLKGSCCPFQHSWNQRGGCWRPYDQVGVGGRAIAVARS